MQEKAQEFGCNAEEDYNGWVKILVQGQQGRGSGHKEPPTVQCW